VASIVAWGTVGIVFWISFLVGHLIPWWYGMGAWAACFLSFWIQDKGWLEEPMSPEEVQALLQSLARK
jgi:hypothetical protein